jgi:hypothetical protein
VRRARAVAMSGEGDEVPASARLASLLEELERNLVSAREGAQSVLPRAIAEDEVTSLLQEHLQSGQQSIRRAQEASGDLIYECHGGGSQKISQRC